MGKRITGLATLLLGCLATAGGAAEATGQGASLTALKEKLATHFPDAKIQAVSPAPVQGLYEVISGNLIVYTDITGDYVVMGPMIASGTRENVTEERLGEINRIDFTSLPFEQALKMVKGTGKRQLAVFADPLCPFCAELEKTLEGITDVTVHIFLMPLESVHPGATAAARQIWCAAEPTKVWVEWMVRDVQPPPVPESCGADPIALNVQLGAKLRMNSTPTLVFGSGVRMSGALAGAQLERLLDGVPAYATAAALSVQPQRPSPHR